MTPEQLRADIMRHAWRMRVNVSFRARPFEAYFDPLDRLLVTQEIRDWGIVTAPTGSFSIHETPEAAYFVAMHELGHAATLTRQIIQTPTMFRSSEDTLWAEAAAWKWALDNSAIPVTEEMRTMAAEALKHYRQAWGWDLREEPLLFSQTLGELNELAVAA